MLNTNCTTCNSIINQQTSCIGSPLCVSPCNPDFGCVDIINTGCVFYNGTNLNTVLAAINSELCTQSVSGDTCRVKVSNSDACCDYLGNKIVSNTLNVSILTNNITNCQSVDIEDKPWTFTNVNYLNGFTTPTQVGYSSARYGIKTGYPTTTNLAEIRFHGQMLTPSIAGVGLVTVSFNLPLSLAPSTNKYINGIAFSTTNDIAIPYSLIINSNGQVGFICNGVVDRIIQLIVPLDNITYIKN